ncbi:unnamed protein product [Clonostachys rosea]|uniref:Isopenicillin N synthase-like Fe(2+) 2OG dioxygenase domain-containing protein n=1 Tax=Bionectria ochroleuca TaxID=29856 RepID=A0ABY6TSC6_BIOOC|nr:unnamed protein product [Clonostachys rosea]
MSLSLVLCEEWPQSAPPALESSFIPAGSTTTVVLVSAVQDAVSHRALPVAKAKERRSVTRVAHLKHSEFDWSIPVEDFGKRCFVKDMGCKGVNIM